MAGNSLPLLSKVAQINWSVAITAANTAKDGTGTVVTIFTADATNGGYVSYISLKAVGTNIQTVARVFINNGSTNATAANNALIAEITLPSTILSETAALPTFIIPINGALPPGYKLNIVLATAVAAGYVPVTYGGAY